VGGGPTPDRFDLVWRKIDRAKEHIGALEAAIDSFRQTQPFTVITEDDHSGPDRLQARIDGKPKPIPSDVALALGDAVHNLRTSLDYFACAVVPTVGNDTGFPISRRRQQTAHDRNSLVGSKMNGCTKPLRAAVLALRPEPGGAEEYLWSLNELDVVDKHRLLLTVGLAYRSFTFDAAAMLRGLADFTKDLPPAPLSLRPADRYPVDENAVLFRAPRDFFEKTGGVTFNFEAAFGEPQTLQGKPLVPTLHELVGNVEGLLQTLAPLA